MATTKPISTISYNTKGYLVNKLNELVRAGKLSFWVAVEHKGEDDEAGLKNHIHVYAEPRKRIEPDALREFLREPNAEQLDKPLGTITWRRSRFGDWWRYAMHQREYLASKGLEKRYTYTRDDAVTSDEDTLSYMVKSIEMDSGTPYRMILEAQAQGLTWVEFLLTGRVPIQQIRQWREAWLTLYASRSE